jgi:hypothetical protein
MLPALPVGLAVPAIIALGVIDRHRENYLGAWACPPAQAVFSPPP